MKHLLFLIKAILIALMIIATGIALFHWTKTGDKSGFETPIIIFIVYCGVVMAEFINDKTKKA